MRKVYSLLFLCTMFSCSAKQEEYISKINKERLGRFEEDSLLGGAEFRLWLAPPLDLEEMYAYNGSSLTHKTYRNSTSLLEENQTFKLNESEKEQLNSVIQLIKKSNKESNCLYCKVVGDGTISELEYQVNNEYMIKSRWLAGLSESYYMREVYKIPGADSIELKNIEKLISLMNKKTSSNTN